MKLMYRIVGFGFIAITAIAAVGYVTDKVVRESVRSSHKHGCCHGCGDGCHNNEKDNKSGHGKFVLYDLANDTCQEV